MRDFGRATAHLQTLRGKFEHLLDAARGKAAPTRSPAARTPPRLAELTGFGSNPGNLRMFVYVPEDLPSHAPLVVALHGCGQNAADYDCGAGWSTLADRLGFAMVYPEQQPANNPKNCFSWFLPGDIKRDSGEALSVRQMVDHAVAAFGADPRRIFVTGLSAGGAMANVMLATYPDLFAGGAIIAGLPYGCAHNAQQAFEAMFSDQVHSGAGLGDRVRAASRHRGPWPRISVWHGSADAIVKPANAENIVRQWTDVHGISAISFGEEAIGEHRRRFWGGTDAEPLIEAYSISGMTHGVPLAADASEESCGTPGAFFLDAGISSTHRIAHFWHLGDERAAPARRSAQTSVSAKQRAVTIAVPAAAASAADHDAERASAAAPGAMDKAFPFDPNSVIAATLKAAGLTPPTSGRESSRAAAGAAPGAAIKAALKAAGLLRN